MQRHFTQCLKILVDWLREDEEASDTTALHRLVDIMAFHPGAAACAGFKIPENNQFNHFRFLNAPDCLALSIIGDHLAYCLSRGGSDTFIFTLVSRGGHEETAHASTLAKAIVLAVSQSLISDPGLNLQ